MFDKHVVARLEQSGFFKKKKVYRWMTLGLIEGEIAPQIDEIAKSHSVGIAYRWHYPYLEIKLAADENEDVNDLVHAVEALLLPCLVSCDGKKAFEVLEESLQHFPHIISVVDKATLGEFEKAVSLQNINYFKTQPAEDTDGVWFCVKASKPLQNQTEFTGMISLECEGFSGKQCRYAHKLSIPNRGHEVIEYAKSYIAWQLRQFIKSLEG